MDRLERSKEKIRELFGEGDAPAMLTENPELQDIINSFAFGEVFYQGNLSTQQRELIILVVLTTNQTLPQLRVHLDISLKAGLTPVEIQEAIYQCAPYLGFPKTLNALTEMNGVFRRRGIALPIAAQGRVEEDTRYDKGLDVQKEIFGAVIDWMHGQAPANQKHIQDYLSAFCFGDFYTRGGLDLQTRELLTLCIVSALGGCEKQVKAHVQGNANVGNSKETLISAVTQCLPYMGFPRTLNALDCINEVLPEPKETEQWE